MPLWHPDALRVPYRDAGVYVDAGAKLVWHTTETERLPAYDGFAPHMTLDPAAGTLWQHIPLDRAARALEHPPGTVDTNRADCVQVELIGFARDTPSWPDTHYERVAALARWIEANHAVPRHSTVTFATTPHRLADDEWLRYAGHLGHEHVPAQPDNHWDPGALRIDLVLAAPLHALELQGPTLARSARGEAVHHLQSLLRRLGYGIAADSIFGPLTEQAVRDFQRRRGLIVDAIVGPRTWAALRGRRGAST
jgi:N-acetyl-anhydromuramyl-L-alanine amidase AmpD